MVASSTVPVDATSHKLAFSLVWDSVAWFSVFDCQWNLVEAYFRTHLERRLQSRPSPVVLQAVPKAIVEKSRGTQLSVVGIRTVHLCSVCDAATLETYHRNRPNPLMPDQLPTMDS